MSSPHPPKFKLAEGESIWTALARELAQRPDGVAALQVQSAINRAIKPSQEAVDRLVEALALQMEQPAVDSLDREVAAATANWEAVCLTAMSDEMLMLFNQDAEKLVQQRRTQPPAFGQILEGLTDEITDYGYQLGGDLEGVRGTLHRLWAALSSERFFGTREFQELCVLLRAEFEQKLGRKMTATEWKKLVRHAHNHCDVVTLPLMKEKPGA